MRPRHSLLPFGLLQLLNSWVSLAFAQQSFFPPAVPLALRSPTFNCWLDTRSGSNPTNTWPQLWNDNHILGWAGYIKVDGLTWQWLGNPGGNASTWISTEITPTRTIMTVQAGPMLLNVTFLSPVEPSDWTRQSFPFSYVYVDGTAQDGNFHSIQLYSDISAEWVTNALDTSIAFGTDTTGNTAYHQVRSSTPTSVFSDIAEDSVAYYAVAAGQPGLVSVIGNDQTLRPQFTKPGSGFTLTSDIAASFGNVRDSNGKFPVFAHAVDLGETQTISSVAWAVGVIRDPVLTSSNVLRRAYYWSKYATIGDAIDAFVEDFPSARARAIALDQKILQDAGAVSKEYADLVSLATRQAMAGVEITLSTTESGEWNFSDVQAFMKDVGNSQRVNPTETIAAALPALMYLNASISGLLLEPLLRFQNSSAYTNPYAASDLGPSYPVAGGNNPQNEGVYAVEDSGSMLVLVLAHASTSGDGSLIAKYYSLLKHWAEYLVTNALIPAQQTPADARDTTLGQNHGNITNLAIKGIIAIQAMAEMSQIMGETADAQRYETTAKSFVQSWVNLTSTGGSLRWTYGADSSFGLMYNLLFDKLLKLNLVPPAIYAQASSSISNQAIKEQPFGFPLSSDSSSNTRSDWTLFSAAAAPNIATRDLLILAVRQRASSNGTTGPFSTLYSVTNGAGVGVNVPNGFASPAQGAMFSLLALNVANKTVIIPSPAVANSSPSSSSSVPPSSNKHIGSIVGGVIAGLAALILLGILAIFLRRRRQRRTAGDVLATPEPYHSVPNMATLRHVGGHAFTAPTTPMSNVVPVSQAHDAATAPVPFIFPTSKRAPVDGSRSGTGTHSHTQSQSMSVSGAPSTVSRGTEDLRNEMATLRREVEQLRTAQGVVPQDAPPVYQ
ncbi:hypothetical protein DFH09DRAFT_1155589 [Mycena vulgaris]|nr:hypothetical protein DFH09DRAFT_1155589 [Mycena vulgaris]